MAESIDTGGGASVEKNVEAGTFIGRDLIVVVDGYNAGDLESLLPRLREILSDRESDLRVDTEHQRLEVTAPGAPRVVLSEQAASDLSSAATRLEDEQAYLAAVIVNPRYGRWSRQFVPLAGTLTVHEQTPGWGDITPEFTELEKVGEGAQRQFRRVALKDVNQAVEKHLALALLGEPGSGKTTTLYRLYLDAARLRLQTREGPLPILLPLADYHRDYSSPQIFLEEQARLSFGLADVSQHLRHGKLFILCDALNEMPFRGSQDYRERVGAWRRFVGDWRGNRVLFTCRSRDYSEPLGMPQVEIERLDDARVREFLQRYLTTDLAQSAWKKLAGTPLLTLVRNPYYLSMLCYLLDKKHTWPQSRAGLFQGFVDTLLKREAQRNHPQWLGEEPLMLALNALAEAMQPLGEGTRLPRGEVGTHVPKQVNTSAGSVVKTPADAVVALGLSATLLDTELAARGGQQVRFYHHQLQEYFAAQALVSRFEAGVDLSDYSERWWRQPRLTAETPDPGPLRDDEPLPSPPTTGWEEPTLLASGLVSDKDNFVKAVAQINLVLAARCLTETGLEPRPDRIQSVQQDLLYAMADNRVHLRARLAAGEALGRLGDPRFAAIRVDGEQVLLPPLVAVSAGRFRMGTGRWEAWRWSRRGFSVSNERPRHPLVLPPFLIGRYPVTNAEYACFMEAGGYQNEHYWPMRRSRAWLSGELESEAATDWLDLWRYYKEDPTRMEQAKQQYGWSPQTIKAWEALTRMSEDEFRGWLNSTALSRPMDRPAYWEDERFNNPSQPVVGVTWYEALAYCRWLNERWHAAAGECEYPLNEDQTVRLSTEAEWEFAARVPSDTRYPWGNHWAADRANTLEAHLLRTSPVGIFPDGMTEIGTCDLSGNVWEWTRSLYQAYPVQSRDGRNNIEAEGARVVRGGSWGDIQRLARCSCRDRDLPGYFHYALGDRVVVSMANSEF